MTERKIHIVSFQNPCPPAYGGMVDVYFRIRALRDAGFSITLHTYAYGLNEEITDELRHSVDTLHVYRREMGWAPQFSLKPYIVNSRRDSRLIDNLLVDDAPILFEGLHDCYYLADKRIRHRLRIVRTHNIEHDYYRRLAQAATSAGEKLYFTIESMRLRGYEKVLRHADIIAAISEGDAAYFATRYPGSDTFHLPCFFDNRVSGGGVVERRRYVIYHDNLGLPENDSAAMSIISEIAPLLADLKVVVAGPNPSDNVKDAAKRHPNVELIANPPSELMDELVAGAQVSLLIAAQASGIRLKLLSSLSKGAFVIVNSKMVEGTGLAEYCDVADTPEDIAAAVRKRIDEPFGGRTLPPMYNNDVSCRLLIDRIENHLSDAKADS